MKTIDKPWGHEVWFAQHKKYLGKILVIEKGHRLSRQYHRIKHETLYVLRGRLLLELGRSRKVLVSGQAFAVPPGTVHRFSAPHGRVTLLEVSTPEISDIVRLADDYGRAGAAG
jgi:quercetin dioxygenase-like cupin family protein